MGNGKKELRSRANLSEKERQEIEEEEKRRGPIGLYGQFMYEPVPDYGRAGSEVVYRGNNNSFIVLGRDRYGNPASGLGGRGATGCGMIDLIAGLDGADSQRPYDEIHGVSSANTAEEQAEELAMLDGAGAVAGEPTHYAASPNFHLDAARLYISQASDVDYYFGIARGSEGSPADTKNKSGAVLKADHARLVGRYHVKIVAGKQKLENGGITGEKSAVGGENERNAPKIDLIAGNYTDEMIVGIIPILGDTSMPAIGERVKKLQPVVKGDNLVGYLMQVNDILLDLSQRITENGRNLRTLMTAFSGHFHPAGGGILGPTAPSDPYATSKAITGCIKTITTAAYTEIMKHDIDIMKKNYLNMEQMATHILSGHVNTT